MFNKLPIINPSSKSSVAITRPATVTRPTPDPATALVVRQVPRGITDDKGIRLLQRVLTDGERALLVRRQHALEVAGTPATPDECTFEIEKMLSGFPSFRAGEAEAAVMEVQYASVLRQFPIWAIHDACSEISSGRLATDEVLNLNPAFPPSAQQLAIVARREVRAMERELAEVREVLAGRVEDARAAPFSRRDRSKARSPDRPAARSNDGRASPNAKHVTKSPTLPSPSIHPASLRRSGRGGEE